MSTEEPTPKTTPAAPPAPKKRRLLHWTLGILLTLVLLVALLAGALWWGVSTEKGTGVLLTRLQGFIPGELTIGARRGPLTGPLDLRDVHYKNETMDARIRHVHLEWNPRKLRTRQLDVERLQAEGVRVTLSPSKKEDTSNGKLVDIHLPVNIVVRDALIRDVEIAHVPEPGQPAAPPFRLDRIALDAQSDRLRDLLHVRGLSVDGPEFKLRASGDVRPVGDYAVDLRADATYDPPDYPPFVVGGTFRGTLEKLGVDLNLSQPFAAHVAGDLLTPMRTVGLDLRAQVRGVETQRINPAWPVARVSQGDVRIKGQLDDFTSEGKVAGSYQDFGSGVATYRLARRGTDFIFEYLNVKTANGSDLTAKGSVGTGKKEMDLDLVADWRRLSWPLQGTPVVVSRTGDAKVRGTLADYTLDVNAELAGPNIPPGRWSVSGRGDQEKMALRSLRGDVLRGRLAAAGTVAWKPQVSWKLQLTGDGLDPAVVSPQWPGRVSFAATTDGTLRNGAPYGRVDLPRLEGNLRGNPLAGAVHLEMAGERYRLPRLDLRSGTARVAASGSFTKDAGDLDWRLDAPNLGQALPQAGGAVALQGHLSGPWKTPHVVARGNGQQIVWQTYNVESLTLNADVNLATQGPFVLDLAATNVGANQQRFETVTLTGRGTRQQHAVTLAVRAQEGTLDVALAGGLRGTTAWAGEIRRLDLRNDQTGAWSLAGPAGVTAGTTGASLRSFCWTSGNARLCAEGQWAKAGPWSGSGTIAALPFSLAKPFLPPDLQITGDLNGTFRGQSAPNGFVTAAVDLRPGPGEVVYPTTNGQTARVRFEQGTVTLTAGADGLAAQAALNFPDNGHVEGNVRLPQYNAFGLPLKQQTLGGHVVANFTNFALAQAFVPDLKNPKGTLDADLTLAGTVAVPKATGAVNLRGAQVDVPKFGLELRKIAIAATSDPQGVLQVRGSAESGGGTLTLAGNVPLDARPARITIEGQRFVVSNTREVKVVVNPKLQIDAEYPKVAVTGDVRVPEAAISQGKRRPGTIQVSKDVIVIPPSEEQAQQPQKQALQLTAQVRVILGDKVTVAATGFTGKLRGSLLITESPDKQPTAVGELLVEDGVYKAYGQDLTLERGRLIFAGGPLENPGLDLQAYRTATDGTVAGIIVKGTLRAPQTTLYSNPPMGESDALAYLLLGHPLGQTSPQEGSLLANAANSLGLKGGNLLAKKIGARFGLEEARIESTGGLQEASLVVGKYLSPRLYVTYGIGLFEPVSTFRLRYILGRTWALQAEQGTGTSADFLYEVERGRGIAISRPYRDPKEPVKVPAATGTTSDSGGGGGR